MSSGALRVNSKPMSDSVFVMMTPQSNSTVRPPWSPEPDETFAFVRSVAVMFSFGFIGSPVNSM